LRSEKQVVWLEQYRSQYAAPSLEEKLDRVLEFLEELKNKK
jgi:hypothetical protein